MVTGEQNCQLPTAADAGEPRPQPALYGRSARGSHAVAITFCQRWGWARRCMNRRLAAVERGRGVVTVMLATVWHCGRQAVQMPGTATFLKTCGAATVLSG